MTVTEWMQDHVLILDGGMGTLLQASGMQPGEAPERRNLTHPEDIQAIHRAYYDAGSHVVSTNTFGANRFHFSREELERVIAAAFANARAARQTSKGTQEKFIALDIGPTGKLLRPYGDLDFDDAVEAFAEVVRLGVQNGADLILIETMNDSYETKAALLAAKENSSLPVFVSNAYGEDGKLMTGATPDAMVALLEGMGADAIGANCSLGPKQLLPVIEALTRFASIPVFFKPNAGLPRSQNGETVFDITDEEFADAVAETVELGVRAVGGCCGTTPRYIEQLAKRVQGKTPMPLVPKRRTVVSSYTHAVTFGEDPLLIGERINPTGKKRFKQALTEGDLDYILREGLRQQEKGAQILDVNVGLPGICEEEMLRRVSFELQAILDLPLQIDTADPVAMEASLRRYNGKAMINSVNGKEESLQAVLPLVKKYGGVVVALTLDESGIPKTADGRVEIAKRILRAAEAYGIRREDIVFDPLAMAVSADPMAAAETLRAVYRIRHELGCHTSLGVSNVSFGLPDRDAINSTFFAEALASGLSAAIMNPDSDRMMQTYHVHRILHGLDENCKDYLSFAETHAPITVAKTVEAATSTPTGEGEMTLQRAIEKGLGQQAEQITRTLCATQEPLSVVQNEIIPALDRVGRRFEEKTLYLPQLLMSAEAAKCAFGVIKASVQATATASSGAKMPIVLATVKGDVHDIGKNIVRLLLENYGFAVTDLGKDVPPARVLEEVLRLQAPMAGLSALMTTTVPAMEETVRLLHENAPFCRVAVGGAVLTAEYAAAIGADRYCKDAMGAVRYAEELQAAL